MGACCCADNPVPQKSHKELLLDLMDIQKPGQPIVITGTTGCSADSFDGEPEKESSSLSLEIINEQSRRLETEMQIHISSDSDDSAEFA